MTQPKRWLPRLQFRPEAAATPNKAPLALPRQPLHLHSPQPRVASSGALAARLLWLAPLLLAVLFAIFETYEFGDARTHVRQRTVTAATAYAGKISRRLFDQFLELEFIGVGLLKPGRPTIQVPDAEVVAALQRFMTLHPNLLAFNIQSPDGRRILWSTRRNSSQPIAVVSDFTQVAGHGNCLLGQPIYASGLRAHVLPMRYRLVAPDGTTRGFVGTPYRLEQLLRSPPRPDAPWVITTTDQRSNRVVGRWHNGTVLLPTGTDADASPSWVLSATSVVVQVASLPLTVRVQWPVGYPLKNWAATSWPRWLAEALVLLALGLLTRSIIASRRAQTRAAQAVERARIQDSVTGLLSRAGFEEQIRDVAAQLPPGASLAVMVIDLERFLGFVAEWGKYAGDLLLRELARRLGSLPDARLLARVGVDSFAFAIAVPGTSCMYSRIESVLALANAPFPLPDGAVQRMSVGVGCALFPADTTEPYALLGLAEAALLGHGRLPPGEEPSRRPAYGEPVREILEWAYRFLAPQIDCIHARFLAFLQADPRNAVILDHLPGHTVPILVRNLRDHIARLLAPDLTPELHRLQSERIGRIHVLVGVSDSAMISAMVWFYQTIAELCRAVPGRLRRREVFLDIITQRIEAELSFHQDAARQIRRDVHQTLQALSLQIRSTSRRVHVLDAVIEALDRLPFMAFSAIYTHNGDGAFLLEAESDAHAMWLAAHPEQSFQGRQLHSLGQHPIARAWSSGEPANLWLQNDAAEQDPAWVAAMAAAGVQSVLALPTLDTAGRIITIIKLYGRLPNQFDTPWMRDWLESVRLMTGRALERSRAGSVTIVHAEDRRIWRERLFTGGLVIHMQPIVDLRSGTCTRLEALARLALADGRILSPAEFLPVLSEQELKQLFLVGLQQALAAIAAYERDGLWLDLSVNLPPALLLWEDFALAVSAALAEHRLTPERLTLELLEDNDLAEPDDASGTIAGLRRLGIKLALDDLGAGYGSLSRLRSMPFDMVKIDQSLVRGMTVHDPRAVPLVDGLVAIAQRLGLRVTIEGLENAELVRFARDLGADFGQGYGIARPMPAADVPHWIARFTPPWLELAAAGA